jgi:hypothetical protein
MASTLVYQLRCRGIKTPDGSNLNLFSTEWIDELSGDSII